MIDNKIKKRSPAKPETVFFTGNGLLQIFYYLFRPCQCLLHIVIGNRALLEQGALNLQSEDIIYHMNTMVFQLALDAVETIYAAIDEVESHILCSAGIQVTAEVVNRSRKLAAHLYADKDNLFTLAGISRGDLVTYALIHTANFRSNGLDGSTLGKMQGLCFHVNSSKVQIIK